MRSIFRNSRRSAAGPAPSGDAEHPLAAHSVCLAYDGTDVVHEVDAHLESGRITALIGPNGSGKSTLLRALAGLHPCAAGSVEIDGSPVRSLAPRALATRLGLLAQNRPTPAGFTVGDVVGFGRHPHRARLTGTDPEGAEKIAAALAATGLTDLADRPVETLSGGQVQRVWLASCLAQDTGVLLLDEPTNHLDLRHQVDLLRLVRRLAAERDLAIGIVLHDLQHAAAVADRLVLMDEGRVIATGEPSEVLRPDLLRQVYGVDVSITTDAATGMLRVETLSALRDVTLADQADLVAA